MYKVSIVTINLNNKEGLEKTVNSVISQTYFNNIEYIVIDGGSIDGSVDVIEKNKDKLHYYVSEKDNGIYDAMNKGVSHATGDYCLFLNSGDKFCKNDVIEKALPHLNEDVVYGNLLLNGKTTKLYPDNINVDYFSYESLPHPSSFIKTQLLRDNPYQTKYGIISDWIFFRESVARGKKFKHIDLVVSDFYLGGASSNVKNVETEKKMYFGGYDFDYEICVVIPCYNQGKYVKETIDSLKEQIYEDFHCVIVNDGSTDNSEEVILENIKDDGRFEYYKNENHGLSYTRNFGISKTNSKYILCLDSDDKISTAYIETAVRYLNKHPETSLFYGRAMLLYDGDVLKYWNLNKFSYEKLFNYNCIYSSCVYRRKDYIRIGGYDETMRGYEDWDFLIRLLYKNDNVYRTDDIVFYYRRHADSMDFRARKNAKFYKNFIIQKNKDIYKALNIQGPTVAILKCKNTESFYGYTNFLKTFNQEGIDDKEYVAVYNIDKKFDFAKNTATIADLFKEYDAIVPKPFILKKSVKENYGMNHNIEDIELVEKIIKEKYPNYVKPFEIFLNGKILIPYGMFIMKMKDFKEYRKFIFDILDEYLKIVGEDIRKRIEDNKEKYLKDYEPNNTVEYQYRIGGYLAERLTNLFLLTHFKKIKTYPVVITENRYGLNNNTI
jgi:glycosyltransferase involved in cell wall biosynthesis